MIRLENVKKDYIVNGIYTHALKNINWPRYYTRTPAFSVLFAAINTQQRYSFQAKCAKTACK